MKWPYYVQQRAEIKARRMVKDDLRRAGHKLSSFTTKEIGKTAEAYVIGHPEMLMEASSSIILELTGLRAEARAEASRPAKAQEKASV